MKRRFCFLVNPKAGRGKALRVWTRIEPLLRHTYPDIEYEVHDSDSGLPHLSRSTVLVAVGGDGTVHRAVQHAMQSSLTLSVIPAGTGNDFVKTIGIPTDPVQALHEMMAGCERVVDILRVNDRWTVNAMGIGLDADVVEAVERHRTVKRMGRLAYAAVLPGVLFRHRRFSLHMLIDGEQVCADDVSLVVVSNGPAFGGGMRLAPQACVDDGLLDVCVVAGITKPRLLMLFPSVYRGRHVHLPYVRFFRGQSIQMSLPEGCKSAQLDGEWLPSVVNLAVSVQANALRLLTPSHR